MNTGPWTINGITYPIIPWDIEHDWHDLVIGCPPGGIGAGFDGWSVSGKRIDDYNYVGPGFSESVVGWVTHHNPTILATGEPDKFIWRVRYVGGQFRPPLTGDGEGITLRFASPAQWVTIRDMDISGILCVSGPRNYEIDSCHASYISTQDSDGYSRGTLIKNSVFDSNGGSPLSLLDGGESYLLLDGTNAAYGTSAAPESGAGIISLLKSYWGSSMAQWAAVPCLTGNLTASPGGATHLFTGSSTSIAAGGVQGNFTVEEITEDANYIYLATNRSETSLPSWADGYCRFLRSAYHTFINCRGSADVNSASIAGGLGIPYCNYRRLVFGGNYETSFAWLNQSYGSLTKIVCTPINLGTNAAAYVIFTLNTFNSAGSPAFVADSGGTAIKFAVGANNYPRIFTQDLASVGPSDTVTVGGSLQPYLPVGRVVGPETTMTVFNIPGTQSGNPEFMLELFFDPGLDIRQNPPALYDETDKENAIFAAIGNNDGGQTSGLVQ
jgi:hypothetical protein